MDYFAGLDISMDDYYLRSTSSAVKNAIRRV